MLFKKNWLKELSRRNEFSSELSYKVIVDGERNHPYSHWFRTRQDARDYKRLLKRERRFDNVYIVKQTITKEGYIWSEDIITWRSCHMVASSRLTGRKLNAYIKVSCTFSVLMRENYSSTFVVVSRKLASLEDVIIILGSSFPDINRVIKCIRYHDLWFPKTPARRCARYLII